MGLLPARMWRRTDCVRHPIKQTCRAQRREGRGDSGCGAAGGCGAHCRPPSWACQAADSSSPPASRLTVRQHRRQAQRCKLLLLCLLRLEPAEESAAALLLLLPCLLHFACGAGAVAARCCASAIAAAAIGGGHRGCARGQAHRPAARAAEQRRRWQRAGRGPQAADLAHWRRAQGGGGHAGLHNDGPGARATGGG